MSLSLNFEPHSWFRGFAIKDPLVGYDPASGPMPEWLAYAEDGNTYQVIELSAPSRRQLEERIREYWRRKNERL